VSSPNSNMVAKNFRIYRIFNNIFITRTVITDFQLIKASSIIITVSMVRRPILILDILSCRSKLTHFTQAVLGVGLAVAPPSPTAVEVSSTQHYWSCDATGPAKVPFQVLTITFAGLLVGFATFLAYKTRLVGTNYSKYNECRQIGFSV
jgi:7 transmembrane sweet-taste receptor of 3 GCPR